jgi:hypothetical protein
MASAASGQGRLQTITGARPKRMGCRWRSDGELILSALPLNVVG